MAAFSSRGPTDDGRVKPDIVAPGTNIVSSRSHYPDAGTLWGVYEENPDYIYSGGTSMATPMVAGAGVLMRQWLTLRGLARPQRCGGQGRAARHRRRYGAWPVWRRPGSGDPHTWPNSIAGWGRADMGFLDAPAPYRLWVDDHTAGLVTGVEMNYAHTSAQPLRVLDSSPCRCGLCWPGPTTRLRYRRRGSWSTTST